MLEGYSNCHFLIVDDDDVDVLAMERALLKLEPEAAYSICHDGGEALAFLRIAAGEGKSMVDYIVLLDLNMPRMNGHEFLQALRADEILRDATVFILSTSTDPQDKKRTQEKDVAGYLPKHELTSESLKDMLTQKIGDDADLEQSA